MLVLGIESATAQVGCAIGDGGGIRAAVRSTRDRRHAESLAPQIRFAVEQAGVCLDDLAVVAVDIGPGLYTGLRVGITTAMALAQTLEIPMIGVSSLDLLAFPVRLTDRLIVTAVDARRSEVFHARYRQVPGGVQRVSDPAVDPPDEVLSEIVACGEDVLLVGDGAQRHRALFESISEVELADIGFAHPSASALVELAHPRAVREEFVRPDQIQPLYLRRPDAVAKWAPGTGR